MFPIFSKNFNANDSKAPTFGPLNKNAKEWVPIGNEQYQLDIGQKAFGLRTCPQCEMQYSVHEPEDELLHLKYHNCVNILTFNGWNNERVVTQIPDWGVSGRILYVCEADSKAKKDRAKEVLNMVDRDLGFAARTELKPKTLVSIHFSLVILAQVCGTRFHFWQFILFGNWIELFWIFTWIFRCILQLQNNKLLAFVWCNHWNGLIV